MFFDVIGILFLSNGLLSAVYLNSLHRLIGLQMGIEETSPGSKVMFGENQRTYISA